MNPTPTSAPARENVGADHDQPYTWGRAPTTYLATRQIARLIMFRSQLAERPTLRNRVLTETPMI